MNPLQCLRAAVALGLATLALSSPAVAQGKTPLGVNLDEVLYYSPEIPFVDVFKSARPWIPQLVGSGGPWNTGAPLALTPEGYPLLAPGQAAATLVLNDIKGNFPAGQYTLLYAGTGAFDFGSNIVVVSQQPGKMVLQVFPNNGGILLRVVATDHADPIRDIRLLLPGFDETTYEQQIFNPTFLERLEPYGFLRFMLWQNANYSPHVHWADRPKTTDWTQATSKGVAYEYMVELANRTQKSPWICVPYKATDDYMTSLAEMLRDEVDPDLPIYLELSNEVWATNYDSGKYAREQGLLLGLSTDPLQAQHHWYAQRSVEMFTIFRNVFGAAAPDRLICVLAGQAGWIGPALNILAWQGAGHHADAFAIAPYFGGDLGGPQMWQTTLGWSMDEIIANLEDQIMNKVTNWLVAHRDLCAQYGLPVICYEAGQRVAAEGPALLSPTLIQKIIDLNRDPRMYDLYWRYMERWEEIVGPNAMAHFVSCRTSSQWGAYGLLEYQHQPIAAAPKYRAVRDWAAASELVFPFGAGCGPASASTKGAPLLGSPDFTLRVEGAPADAPAWLLLGFSWTQYGGAPLPAFLGPIAPGCALQVSIDVSAIATTGANGRAEVELAIPTSPGLVGLEIYSQWVVADPLVNPLGLDFAAPIGFRIAQ